MCTSSSQIVASIGQIEALIDQRKVRNDISDDSPLDRRPIRERWIPHLAAMDIAIFSDHDAIEDVSPPAFDRRESPFSRARLMTRRRQQWARRNFVTNFTHQTDRFMDLVHAYTHAFADIAIAIAHDVDR